MREIDKNPKGKLFFIGVSGSGTWPLANLASRIGYRVCGSDIRYAGTKSTKEGPGPIYSEHSEKNISADVSLVVYSGAIGDGNPELVYAREHNIPTMTRSQFLGYITQDYKLIAVAGTHGKTTASSMITKVLIDCGISPTSIIGAYFDEIDGGCNVGTSDVAVCEACEYQDSFLDLDPYIGIILNIDNDHLDYFKTIDNVKKSFLKFAKKCKLVIINKDDNNAYEISKKLDRKKVIYFSLNDRAVNCASNISFDKTMRPSFDLIEGDQELHVHLKVRGKHNIMNSLASFCACKLIGADENGIVKSLEKFRGANRRFQFIGEFNGVSIFDDFAHHPTEIESTLNTAKKMSFSRVIVVFQPHTFSRTFMLLDDLARALSICDKAIITDILPVREVNTYGVSSNDLAAKIPNSIVIKDADSIANYLKEHTAPGDMILTMGGGDIYTYIPKIVEKIKA